MEFLVDDVIKCPQCKEVFKSPVNLPCGHSICKHHIDEYLINDNDRKKIECLVCKQFHQIHESDVLMPNKTIEILLKKNMEKIDLGKEYNSAIDKCNIFGDLLDKFNKIKNDPEMRIYSVISELKNKVDLRREEMKQEIDKEALKMIEKLNEYQKECKMKMKIDPDSKLDEKLEDWKNNLKQWQIGLNTFDNINRERILAESTSELKGLHSELLTFEESLFLNRLNQFKFPNIFSFNNQLILK